MARPEYATAVSYTVSGSSDMDEVVIQFTVGLTTSPDLEDTAAQAVADAAVTHLRSVFGPDRVNARRHYHVADPGEPWPAPPEPQPEEPPTEPEQT